VAEDELTMAATQERASPTAPERNEGLRLFATLSATYTTLSVGGGGQPRAAHPCRTRSIAIDRSVVEATTLPRLGDKVCLNVSGVGLVTGQVQRLLPGGFVLANEITRGQVAKLEPKLRWLKQYFAHTVDNRRSNERHLAPPYEVTLMAADGTAITAHLHDLSASGLGFMSTQLPTLGQTLSIGDLTGSVARHFEGGFALRLDGQYDAATLKAKLRPAKPQ
jgi:hypothetical protein